MRKPNMQRGLATELNLLDKTTAAFLTSRDEGRTWTYLPTRGRRIRRILGTDGGGQGPGARGTW